VQLLYPLGLLALASLMVPLLIHLWNVKQGKTLKIGSIALLGESSKVNSKSFRITDWLLLLIRCLLLTVLTVILCYPYLLSKKNGSEERGWIMIPAARLKQVYTANKTTMDSLLTKEYKIHDFGFGFKELDLADTIKSFPADTPLIGSISLLKQLNSILGNGFQVVLYADKKLQDIDQTLPPLNFNLRWNAPGIDDTPKTAAINYGDRMYSAKLSPFYTNFKWLKNGDNTGVIRVAIFQESNAADSRYVASAVQSIASYRELRADIKYVTNATQLNDADLIFWLSPKKLSDEVLSGFKKQAKIYLYAPGKAIELNSFVNLKNGSQTPGDPSLSKRIVVKDYQGAIIWSDYQGTPLLTKEIKEGRDLYQLYTRFNPNWTSLVWQDQFVKSLIPIVSPEVSAYSDFGYVSVPQDQRVTDIKISNTRKKAGNESGRQTINKEPLNNLFWMIGFSLFCLERFISLVKRRRLTNG
jgi:hypothetical protein